MLTLATNVNGTVSDVAFNDLYLNADGNIATGRDQQAVLEGCAHVAQTLLGELVLNINQGIPYFQTLWIGVPNITQFNAALRAAFLSVPNVIEVVSLFTTQNNDTLTYTAVIRSVYGSSGLTGVVLNA